MVRSRWSFSEWRGVVWSSSVWYLRIQCNNAHSFFSFEHPFTSNRQNLVSCHAEVEKTEMIGALPVLVPGWGKVCVQAV